MVTPYILLAFFNLFLYTHQKYLLCPTTLWKNSLRKDNKGQDDSFIPSEMAFKEWYEIQIIPLVQEREMFHFRKSRGQLLSLELSVMVSFLFSPC